MEKSKSIFTSKTFWANTIAMVATVGAMFGLNLNLDAEMQAQIVAVVMGVVNIALRFKTNSAVHVKK